MPDQADIQIQYPNGNWRTIKTIYKINDQNLILEMQMMEKQYPGYRVRAVDNNSRLLDIL